MRRFGIWIVATLGLVGALVQARPGTGPAHQAAAAAAGQGHKQLNGLNSLDQRALGPEDALLFSRQMADGTIPAGAFARAGRQRDAVARLTAREAPRLAAARWTFLGPSNIGGRVVDMAVDPARANTVYIATATGGVWKTTDSGQTFAPAWPAGLPQSIGALAMAADGTLYAGTGEANPGGGSITYGGDGIYRSTDRGKTWHRVGLYQSSTIGRIVVDPSAPKRVYAAVTGNLFRPEGQRGLYVSDNGGTTWRRALVPPNETTGAVDVTVDPHDPARVFVTMWDHLRKPDQRRYTGPGSGIWRTTDGGLTWEHLTVSNGLPADSDANGRIGVAIDPRDSNHLYAIYANSPTGAFQAFFVSTDGGDTWTAPPQAQSDLALSQYVYGWWFARLWVDPKNGNHLFLAGLELYQSTDGGSSFSLDGSVHPDQHALAWDPRVAGRVYLGDDGGFYRSDTNGTNGSWNKATYEPWSQYSSVDVSEQDPTRISGGLQDNGSIRSWGGSGWNQYYGGDGQKNLINPKDADNVYACLQYGDCVVSETGGGSQSSLTTVADRYNYFSPMEFDPSNPDIVYLAGDVVNRSADRGQTFTPISPDLGKGEAGGEINPLYAAHYGTVTTLAVAKTDGNTIWAGTDNGYLWKTTDQGTTWTEITSPVLPKRWISRLAIDPANRNTVYVTFSGYRGGDNSPYVLRTTDGGTAWRDLTGNLPWAPVTDVVPVKGKLYVSTDVGVYLLDGATGRWHRVGSGLPDVPVTDLRYVPTNHTMYAATFGRGVWSIPLS